MIAAEILALLARRHREDLFFEEVKDGQTWGGSGLLRIDALAIPKSWSPMRLIGYEVKVDRGDWLADTKWPAYLDVCNVLSLVCPAGVVHEQEVHDGVGLVVVNARGTGLRTVRKPSCRPITPHRAFNLLLYLLMNRVVVGRPGLHQATRAERVAEWEAWAKTEGVAKVTGPLVRAKIAERLRELENRAEKGKLIEVVEEWLTMRGIDRWYYGDLPRALDKVVEDQVERVERARAALRAAALEAARTLVGAAVVLDPDRVGFVVKDEAGKIGGS